MSVPFPKPFSHLRELPACCKPRKDSQADLHFIRDGTQRYRMIWLNRVTLRGELKYSLSRSSQENVAWSSITAELLTASLNSTPTRYLASMKLLMSLLNIGFSQLLKSACHQLELNPRDREFTAFESGNHYISGDGYRLVLSMLCPNSNERLITLSERTTWKGVILTLTI